MVQFRRLASDLGGDRRARAQSISDCHRVAIQRRHLDADVVGGSAVQTDVVVPSLAALVGGHWQ
jgi:hypothetical protein